MRVLLLTALFWGGCLASRIQQCSLAVGDEDEYSCSVDNATIVFGLKKNDYVNVACYGSDFSCDNIPLIGGASNLTLKSLGIKYCPPYILRCINEVIEATSVDRVTLERLNGSLVKEDVENLDNVTAFTLRLADKQTSLPIEAINSFPSLRSVRLNGAHLQLSADVWAHSPPITYLELSEDHLTALPPLSFQGLTSLETLSIWGNSIERLEDGTFTGLDSLRYLAFSNNKLKSITTGALSGLGQLHILSIRNNVLETLPDGLLEELTQLVELQIVNNRVELTLGSHAFSNLPSLKTVNIESNEKIRSLPSTLFRGSTRIELLQLSRNKIEELPADIFSGLVAVSRLDLSRNRLRNISDSVFVPLKSLLYLNLNYNQITSLPKDLFAGLTALKEVFIENNNIVHIHSSALSGASHLQTLSLAHNELTLDQTTSKYQFLESGYSPFQALENLMSLDLSGNQISVLMDDFRYILLKLETLNLSYNNFTEITFDPNPNATYILSKVTVDLRHNQIKRVIVTARPLTVDTRPTVPRMLLDHNPLVCDCHMYRVRQRVDGLVYTPNEPEIVLEDAYCSSPPRLQGTLVTQVLLSDFLCHLPDADNCSSLARPATNELLLHCPKLPSKLPDMSTDDVFEYFVDKPTINLKLDRQPKSLGDLNVHTLNLSRIHMESINFKPSKYLKKLDVSHNSITTVPKEFLDANIALILSNNSLDCTCWETDIISEIKNSRNVFGATCSDGQTVSSKDVTTLCNTEKAAAVGITTFVLVALFVAVAIFLIYKYYYKILVWMINKEIFKGWVKEIVQDKDKTYDVFISYAHEDANRVHNVLLPKLEKDFEQKVCVHYRDWVIGGFIPTQIQQSVEKSRRTMIILSNSFLNSEWANMEFFAAHNLAQKEQRNRVILVLLDESVATHTKLSKELRAYISNNTYLLWDDPRFWERLRRVLPMKQYKINWPRAFGRKNDNDVAVKVEKPMKIGLNVQLNSDNQLVNMARDEEKNTLAKDFV